MYSLPSPQQLIAGRFFLQRIPCPVTLHSTVGTQHGQQTYMYIHVHVYTTSNKISIINYFIIKSHIPFVNTT